MFSECIVFVLPDSLAFPWIFTLFIISSSFPAAHIQLFERPPTHTHTHTHTGVALTTLNFDLFVCISLHVLFLLLPDALLFFSFQTDTRSEFFHFSSVLSSKTFLSVELLFYAMHPCLHKTSSPPSLHVHDISRDRENEEEPLFQLSQLDPVCRTAVSLYASVSACVYLCS